MIAEGIGYFADTQSTFGFGKKIQHAETFFKGGDAGIGAIEGSGSGGITLNTSSGDYAEYLPVIDRRIDFEDGDVVGIFGGRISRKTAGADMVLAISSTPIILGNNPGEKKIDRKSVE